MTANEEGRALPTIRTTPCVDGTVQLAAIEVRTPDGKELIKPLDLRLEVGDTLVVTGPSAPARPRCCAAWPSCGPSPPAR